LQVVKAVFGVYGVGAGGVYTGDEPSDWTQYYPEASDVYPTPQFIQFPIVSLT